MAISVASCSAAFMQVSWVVRDCVGALRSIVEPLLWQAVVGTWMRALWLGLMALRFGRDVTHVEFFALERVVFACRQLVAYRLLRAAKAEPIWRWVQHTWLAFVMTAITVWYVLPLAMVCVATASVVSIGTGLLSRATDWFEYVVAHVIPPGIKVCSKCRHEPAEKEASAVD